MKKKVILFPAPKKNYNICGDNYRGFSLIDSTGKILASLLFNRLRALRKSRAPYLR